MDRATVHMDVHTLKAVRKAMFAAAAARGRASVEGRSLHPNPYLLAEAAYPDDAELADARVNDVYRYASLLRLRS